jgi:SagB-type dehydrogenase family enzyme
MAMRTVDTSHIGEVFQELTKYAPTGALKGEYAPKTRQERKTYPAPLARVHLPPAVTSGGLGIWEIVCARRSVRTYVSRALELAELAQILWASHGVTGDRGPHTRRTTPSAGGFYPIQSYAIVRNVRSLDAGIYYYDPLEHTLIQLHAGCVNTDLAVATQYQTMCANAPLVLAWTALVGFPARYCGQRAYRYIYIEAGHCAQNVILAAIALGLGTCQIGGFFDDKIRALLGIQEDTHEPVIYLTTVGPSRPSSGTVDVKRQTTGAVRSGTSS